MEFEDIMSRVKSVIERESNKRVFDKDIAKALNIHVKTFSVMKSRNKIPFDKIIEYCAKRKISLNWIFYNQSIESIKKESEEVVYIKYFKDIRASAGGGALNDCEEDEYISIDIKLVKNFGGKSELKYIESIRVAGDSMEPTLQDGDLVFLNRRMIDVKKDGIFVLRSEQGLLIKRLYLDTKSKLHIISDNSIYPKEILDPSEVAIIGKVVGVLNCYR